MSQPWMNYGGPPSTLAAETVVDESGHIDEEVTPYVPQKNVGHGIDIDSWHPPIVHPVPIANEEPLDAIYAREVVQNIALLGKIYEEMCKPQKVPWVYRGPLQGSGVTDGSGDLDVVMGVVPAGEIWEIESVGASIIGTGSSAGIHVFSGPASPTTYLATVNNTTWDALAGQAYSSGRFSPVIRVGAGTEIHVALAGADTSAAANIVMQYRMFRVPFPPNRQPEWMNYEQPERMP